MPDDTAAVPQRLLLLRHGEVESHRGDVPVTPAGRERAAEVGRRLAAESPEKISVLTGETRRTRETAESIATGAREAGAEVDGPATAFALRNPDLYVAGQRVNMVSSVTALAEQLDGLDEQGAARVPFFAGFLAAPDRIGWWLHHASPPGDDAATVARRIRAFAGSLADRPRPGLTVAVTHSPVLRAVALAELGEDTGEPPWVAGLVLEIQPDRSVRTAVLAAAP
ncbi:broad specificity phosphatase PhoE [Georgenia soli]|uniref:Broad specificity phosphatase PhoE n=1 Tax=Georgenia soli TaxID=638953 RepID=A0A2A9EQD4_9MICO|nr:histidine phosphatase family protein [Georgenia soli]PFG41108.1 broad specificity phosphatase PhoE [Georgenia soli]